MKPLRLLPIDFNKPWWDIIAQQRWTALGAFCTIIIWDVFWTLLPFLISYTLDKASWSLFALTCILFAASEGNRLLMSFFNIRLQLQCIHSLSYGAHRYLLMIDLHYHVKRSSGAVLAKIDRASRGYEDFLDQIVFEFSPLLVAIITMIVILIQYSLALVIGVCCCLALMITYAYYYARYYCIEKETRFITSDDTFRATALENLSQIQLIRTTFTTEHVQNDLKKKAQNNCKSEQQLWWSYSFTSRFLTAIYALSILMLLGYFVYCVRHGVASVTFAIGIVLAYIQSTNRLIRILQPLRKFMRGYTSVQDLYQFMRQFGKQTIPLFETAVFPVSKDDGIDIVASHITFHYDKAHLFDGHTLHITVPSYRENKLYGIIGPSGTGKTTLISILGGQLKPLSGSVLINGIDIYKTGDAVRQQLIALQNQAATSMKGSVRYNLLFGLPENHGYTDADIVAILKKVGLYDVLMEHQGLETELGEGASNLSGGQKQRLSFVSLYLRARFYKPLLILIDEPTSSLDEISESAITAMISELARDSVTFVIAHRLKTLKDAIGLIDLSLLKETKEIKVYSDDELKNHSAYYRKLLEGVIDL